MNATPPTKRRGLGRGLGSLIPTSAPELGAASVATAPGSAGAEPAPTAGDESTLAPVDGAWFAELPILSVSPNKRQPREVFDEEAMAELVHSIREIGLLQPVVVRRSGADPDGQATYELVMGERRWRASQEAGLTTIPAIVRETEDTAMLRDALLENLHRSQLNPLEEAAAYAQLLDDFGGTHEELARKIGRSRPQISNTLRLLKLSPRCSDVLPPACCRPGTPGPCSASRMSACRIVWPNAWWPRGSASVVSRRSCPSARGNAPIAWSAADPPRLVWSTWLNGSRIASRRESRSIWAAPRERSAWSSPRSMISSASWTSWIQGTGATAPSRH